MTAHIVMPARRSAVPGHWMRACTAIGCGWTAHRTDRDLLAQLAHAHHEHPDEPTPNEGEQLQLEPETQS